MRFPYILFLFVLFVVACNNDDDDDDNSTILKENISYTFEVTFTNLWDSVTYPTDYPTNPTWGTFTGLTHTDNNNILIDVGENASAGLKTYAESGDNTTLISEINGLISNNEATSINAFGGTAKEDTIKFEYTTKGSNPYVTILSKITPSPDWIIAIQNVDMRNVSVVGSAVTYYVTPYDIGSKSGESYTPFGETTSEQISIKKDAPFVNEHGVFDQLGIIKISLKSIGD